MKKSKQSEKKEIPEKEVITLQAPPLNKSNVEDDKKEVFKTENIRTGFVKEAEDDWVDDVFLDIPYEDEIIEPIDDYVDYEAALVDNDVVYRIRNYGTRNTQSEWNTNRDHREEKEEIIIMKSRESVKEEVVQAENVKKEEGPYDDESKILPVNKQTVMIGKQSIVNTNYKEKTKESSPPPQKSRPEIHTYSNIPNPNRSLISANTSMNKSFTRGSKQKIFAKSHLEIKKKLESIDKNNIDILGSLIENEEEYKKSKSKGWY